MKFLSMKANLLFVLSIIFMIEGCTTNPNIVMKDSSLPPKASCVNGPFEGTCIDTNLPPTCYKSLDNQRNPICGPMLGNEFKYCDSAYECYVMGRSRVCCDYCPGEWSGNCLGLQPEKSE